MLTQFTYRENPLNMNTASFGFVFYGLLVAAISNLSRSPQWRSLVLLLASGAFLGLLGATPFGLLPIAGFLLLGYAAIVLSTHYRSSAITASSVVAAIFVYIWLKRYEFLPHLVLLHFPYFTLGISYILFRLIHLIVESGSARVSRRLTLWQYLLYTVNFTTLLCGPIQDYEHFAQDQFSPEPVPLDGREIIVQIERIVRGMFKFDVLATILHAMQIKAIAQISQNSPIPVKLQCGFTLAIAYPLFLYANFSGYIDIVIALARLMRIRLPENFNHPFAASSFLDFWNRWHITLSTWLKNYVYNPLLLASMRRIGAVSMQSILGVFCFFFTFSLVGIWHGRSSEFVFFGILQGGGVSVNKLWQLELTRRFGRPGYKALAQKPVYVALGRGLTFSWFTFTLLWFWGSWPQIILMFTALGALHWLALWLIIWLSATLALTAWEWLRARLSEIMTGSEPVLTSLGARLIYITVLVATVFVFSVMRSHTAPGLVYKGF